jgi:hypothetical protein
MQQVDGKAEISALPDENGSMGNLVELTPLYRDQVTHVQRSVRLNADRSMTIADEWTTSERATEVSWQWLTRANATATANGFKLKQVGKTLRLRAISSTKLTLIVEDVSKPKNSFDSPNPGLSRLIIRLQTPAQTNGWLSVTALPGSAK